MDKTNGKPAWCNIINATISNIESKSRDNYESIVERNLKPYGITKLNACDVADRVYIEEERLEEKGYDSIIYQRFYIDGEYEFTIVCKHMLLIVKDVGESVIMAKYETIIEDDRVSMTNEEAIDILDRIIVENHDRVAQAIKKAKEALKRNTELEQMVYGDIPQSKIDFKAIEKALGFKLFYWQKTYIETGIYRRYGDTTAQILRQLLDPKFNDIPIIIDKAKVYSKYSYYGDMMVDIKNKLDAAGIKTRPLEIKRGYWNE